MNVKSLLKKHTIETQKQTYGQKMSLLEEVEIRENNKKKEQCKNVIKL
jgi:hypothetical protein